MTKYILTFLLASQVLFAQFADETGSSSFPYKPSGFSGKPKAEEIASAVKAAKLDALNRYVSSMDNNSINNYQKIKSSIEANLDNFISSVSILRQEHDKRQKLIFVTLRASINAPMIRNRLQQSGTAAQVPSEEKSYVCSFFAARRQASVKAFDQKRVTANRYETSNDEFEEVASNGVSTSITSDQRKESINTTAGSTEIKSDAISWDIFPAQDLDRTIKAALATAGYKMVPAESLGAASGGLINTDEMKIEYSQGNDLSQQTIENLNNGCAKLGIIYVARGDVSVQPPKRDPISGLTKVTVSVSMEVNELEKTPFGTTIPVNVASISSQQYSALGDSQTTAENSAIRLAAEKAGELIVAGLQNSDVK